MTLEAKQVRRAQLNEMSELNDKLVETILPMLQGHAIEAAFVTLAATSIALVKAVGDNETQRRDLLVTYQGMIVSMVGAEINRIDFLAAERAAGRTTGDAQ